MPHTRSATRLAASASAAAATATTADETKPASPLRRGRARAGPLTPKQCTEFVNAMRNAYVRDSLAGKGEMRMWMHTGSALKTRYNLRARKNEPQSVLLERGKVTPAIAKFFEDNPKQKYAGLCVHLDDAAQEQVMRITGWKEVRPAYDLCGVGSKSASEPWYTDDYIAEQSARLESMMEDECPRYKSLPVTTVRQSMFRDLVSEVLIESRASSTVHTDYFHDTMRSAFEVIDTVHA